MTLNIEKKVYVGTNGCNSALTDANTFRSLLVKKGYTMTLMIEDADLLILNPCSVSRFTADASFEWYDKINTQRKADSTLVVTGCIVSMDERSINRMNGADYVISLRDEQAFKNILQLEDWKFHLPTYEKESRLDIKVVNGCDGACSFCAIPQARGRLRSYSIEDISNKILSYTCERPSATIGFVGEDVGAWGIDKGLDIRHLLRETYKIPTEFRVKIEVMNPWYFIRYPDLDEVLAEGVSSGRIIPDFGLPLQSGNNRILGVMKRQHTIDQYLKTLDSLKEKIPDVRIATDIIVGFPTETHEEFLDSFNLLSQREFSFYGLRKYEDMPKTLGVKMQGKVSEDIKRDRLRSITILVMEQLRKKYSSPSFFELAQLLIHQGETFPLIVNDKNIFGGTKK